LRVTANGQKTYIFKYRVGGGRAAAIRKPTIGKHGEITPDEARKIALSWAAKARAGEDPSGERQERRKELTVAELATRYLEQHASVRKKPRSVEEDEGNLNRHILPALGKLKISDVTRKYVTTLHHAMKDKPTTANRIIALLSKMFNLAEAWGLRPDNSNPCRHVQKYKETKRKRYLSEAELARIGEALEQELATHGNTSAVNAIRLLILTGCRYSEILTLTWEEVDLEHRCLRLKDSKTGAKTVPLNAHALALLASIERRENNPYVIVGSKEGAHLVNLPKVWRRVSKAASLEDVRLHDLRHTYASVGVAGGFSLPVIGALLGHTQAATTQRYAHLADDPLKHATDAIGARIAAAMEGKVAAPVTRLHSSGLSGKRSA
jgi:integrase